MLHSEDVESGKNGTRGKLSFNSFFLPRLASGAVIIIRANVTNGTVLDPYFVSAAYDQGSNQYPNFLPVHVQTGLFPDILAGRIDPAQQLTIVATILSAVSFTVALIGIKIKKRIQKGLISTATYMGYSSSYPYFSIYIIRV